MQWYRKNVKGPLIFLIVSDDVKWCKKHLLGSKDVKIASKSPEHDLALLSFSNHTIIDYGTFGYWGASMAGGHTISLNVDQNFNKLMTTINKKWHVFENSKFSRKSAVDVIKNIAKDYRKSKIRKKLLN